MRETNDKRNEKTTRTYILPASAIVVVVLGVVIVVVVVVPQNSKLWVKCYDSGAAYIGHHKA